MLRTRHQTRDKKTAYLELQTMRFTNIGLRRSSTRPAFLSKLCTLAPVLWSRVRLGPGDVVFVLAPTGVRVLLHAHVHRRCRGPHQPVPHRRRGLPPAGALQPLRHICRRGHQRQENFSGNPTRTRRRPLRPHRPPTLTTPVAIPGAAVQTTLRR